jgi:hypothetical protein
MHLDSFTVSSPATAEQLDIKAYTHIASLLQLSACSYILRELLADCFIDVQELNKVDYVGKT